jgi:hypothetical protein
MRTETGAAVAQHQMTAPCGKRNALRQGILILTDLCKHDRRYCTLQLQAFAKFLKLTRLVLGDN